MSKNNDKTRRHVFTQIVFDYKNDVKREEHKKSMLNKGYYIYKEYAIDEDLNDGFNYTIEYLK